MVAAVREKIWSGNRNLKIGQNKINDVYETWNNWGRLAKSELLMEVTCVELLFENHQKIKILPVL